ncbi:hypothetical protein L1987_23625 [Smallanthus sonchifolius]|uniref:Uncharacterized protein n=1 Tax=Smallanthus sonchifolius TaxID=185202 RepID=A0ACB9IJN0_9ASTR|nr:hypothetical protein L1987_23625 [Smallanthus sonchifolius]
MSFDTITQVAPFDSLPDQEYVFPPESQIFDNATTGEEGSTMLRDLFRARAAGELLRKDLNILPKLLSLIAQFNVIPRLGDKDKKTKQRIKGLLDHVQPLEGEDEGEEENYVEEEEGDDDATVGDGGARGRVYEDDLLEAIVRSARPPEYDGWPKLIAAGNSDEGSGEDSP